MPDVTRQRPVVAASAPRRMLSIRARLMILAVLAIAPLLVERIYDEESDRQDRIEAAYKHATGLARQGAVAQNEAIVAARSLLQAVTSARAAFNLSDSDCSSFLKRIATPTPWIKTLSVANLQGKIVCSSFAGAVGLDVSERPHFTKAIDSGDFFVSDYIVAARTHSPTITVSLAQRGANGAAAAVAMGLLDLGWFEHLAKTFVPPSGFMLLVDGKGTVLAEYPSGADNSVGRVLRTRPLVKAMLAAPEGSVIEPALDGVRRIFGFIQLPGTQARIAVGLDEKEVLARADHEMWQAFAEAGVVAALVLLGIWFGGERLLVRPILTLAKTAGRIGRGEEARHAVELPWAPEFVPLAAALDDMAARLSAREQELRDTNDQLRELAQTDALTGLPNRRSFNERLADEWKLAVKLRQPIAVLMIDVDFFKKFNDHYGHVQGDACLRKVSKILMDGTRVRSDQAAPAHDATMPPSFDRIAGRARRADFAARYGGEEFAVLLQGADRDVALRIADRLRDGVENLLMAHAGAPWGFVSISIGAASISPSEHDNPEELTEAADGALYEAKRQGRNRVAGSAPVILSQAG